MNSEFAWSVIVLFIALVLGGVAVGLYFYWKDKVVKDKDGMDTDDYDKNKKIIVWSIAISSGVILVFGVLLMIWAIHKRGHTDVAKRTAAQNKIKQSSVTAPKIA